MKIAYMPTPEFGEVPIIERRIHTGVSSTPIEQIINKPLSALDKQVSGNHYKDCKIQPIEYIHANGLDFCEGNVVKYITRWRAKNGIKDLEKAKHYVELLIELEQNNV